MINFDPTTLTIDSTLNDLPMYDFQVEANVITSFVSTTLEEQPQLPGVIVSTENGHVGVISRQKFFEQLGQLYGVAIHLKRPIHVMLEAINEQPLMLGNETSIHEAVSAALGRSQHLAYEPILVQFDSQTYRLLDVYTLLLAQSKLFSFANSLIQESNEILEERVTERTAALAETNETLKAEISERERTENLLRRSEETNHALLNAIPDLILRVSRDGVYLGMMGASDDKFNFVPEQFIGRRLSEVLPGFLAQLRLKHIQQALETGQTQVYEYQYNPHNHRLEDYEDRIVVCGQDEILLLVRNITERKQTEQERIHLMSENLQLTAELGVTRDLQLALLPKPDELQQVNGLEIATFMDPAETVGGDYFDILQDGNRVKIGIGDVTGHGLDSSITMLMTQTAVRTLLLQDDLTLPQFVSNLNQALYGNVQRMKSGKTLSFALLDYELIDNGTERKGILNISGQHESVIIVRQNGQLEVIDTNALGFPLALEEDISDFVDQTSTELYPGDTMILYTDGIIEAENEAKTLYGIERLCEVAVAHHAQPAEVIKTAIVTDVKRHVGLEAVYDDLTVLVLKQY